MRPAIRDMTDADVDWCVDLLVDWDPAFPPEHYRRVLTGEAGVLLRNRLALVGDEPAGLGSIIAFEGLAHPLVSVVIARHLRGMGVGSALFADVWPHVPAGGVVSGMPDGVRVVQVAASEPDGIDIDAFLDLVGDYPEAEVYGDRLSNAVLLEICPAASWVVLLDDDGVVAGTALDSRDGEQWYVLFTGCVPRARGRGLARAVKQAAHRIALEGGASSVRTTNEDRNERMRALNAAPGYQRVSGDLRLFRST